MAKMKLPAFLQRIVRMSMNGLILPVTSFVTLSVLLSFILVLYKPSAGPTRAMRVGWQEWSQISFNGPQDTGKENSTTPPPGEDKSTDWWETDENTNSDSPSSSSLPLDSWLPFQPHDTGISEITVTRCYMDHAFGLCYPDTTPEADRYGAWFQWGIEVLISSNSKMGKWTRVERDLQAKNGIYYLSFYYRRTRRLDIPLITDFMLLGASEEHLLPHPVDEWRGVPTSLRDGVIGQPALYLWYKLGPPMGQLNATQADNLITEVDVLNGEGPPFYGFEKLMPELSKARSARGENAYMTFRRGRKIAPRPKPLHFSHSGHFKIMQIADLHFSVGHGHCKETSLTPCENGDDETLALMGRILDLEKPNLVVFSGDQLNGQGTSWDAQSVLQKFAGPVIDRKIPWAAVFGNHDTEDETLTRNEQVKIMRALPYSLIETGPDDVHGTGNYVLAVKSPDPSRTQLLTLYFLDSGSYSAGIWDWFGFTPTAYDYLRQSQIDWFLQESSLVPMHERPWHPDGGRDLGSSWRRASQGKKRQAVESSLVKPNAIMFYHIPIQETYSTADIDVASNRPLDIGEQLDPQGSPKKNEGFFEKALLKAKENELGGREVKVVANGHSHLSNNCRRVLGIWFCFNGGSSYSGYGKVGVDRRFRIFNITEWGETITSYERTEHEEIVDKIVLVGEGGPAPYEG